MRHTYPPKCWTRRKSISWILIASLVFTPFAPTFSIDFDADLVLQVTEGARGLPLGDLNGDGETDEIDLFYLALYWRNPITEFVTSSPISGESDVATTRETILRFSNPIDPGTVGPESIIAVFGGIILGTRLHTSPDGKTVTIFYNDPLPPNARIRVTVDGDKLKDQRGVVVEADRDGLAGGVETIDFDTLTLTTLPGTSVFGRVFATELLTAKGSTESVNVPLKGVRITVDGYEDTLIAETDSLGNFRLDRAPAGAFFVHVDGRTVSEALIGGATVQTSFPNGHYYPYIGKKWESIPGRETNIGTLYLPLVIPGTLHPVSTTQETVVGFADAVLAEHPEFAGAQVIVPPDSLYADDGTRGGMVGIAPVPPDRMPGTLPDFMMPGILISVQTDGGTNFDTPLPLCLPNIADPFTGILPSPGERRELFSFNHDIGDFEPVGSMTVSEDGTLVCTDPGVGIPAPGWHFGAPRPKKGRPRQGCDSSKRNGPIKRKGRACDLNPPMCDFSKLAECNLNCEDIAANDYSGLLLSSLAIAKLHLTFTGKRLLLYTPEQIADLVRQSFIKCLDNCLNMYCPNKGSIARRDLSASVDPVIVQLLEIVGRIGQVLYPFSATYEDLDSESLEALQLLIDEADFVAGGDALQYLRASILEFESEFLPNEDQVDEVPGEDVSYPVPFAAQILRPSETLLIRGRTKLGGIYSVFVPTDGILLNVHFYDPLTDSAGIQYPFLSPEEDLPPFTLFPIDESFPDYDQDSLVDFAEFVLGTQTNNPDTDNDGVPDGVEAANGTNPLDGLPTITGIIATADTPGTAVDVATGNELVLIADSNAGISVFNVYNGMNPVIVAQIDTPGTGQRVAISGNAGIVADGGAGMAIVDLSDPPSAEIMHQVILGGFVQAAAAAGDVAYAGLSNGDIVWVDIATGDEAGRVRLPFPIRDLAVQGDYLYALTDEHLFALNRFAESMPPLNFASSPFVSTPNSRLFVGRNLAYAVHGKGYNTFSLMNPEAPALIEAGETNFFGWKQIVDNGAGLGVAAVGSNSSFDGPHNVSLYDISNPTETNVFITEFETPGIARAVSIYNGLAYAADHTNGMQVINYIAYDNLGQPPSVRSLDVPDLVEEGQAFQVTVDATDDVQIRNVEFHIDGAKQATDGNFPFEVSLVAPSLVDQATFLLQVRVSDTGGNFVLSETREIQIVVDMTGPRVRSIDPVRGDYVGQTAAVSARFSEDLDPNTVIAASFQLFEAGSDGLPGNSDDIPIGGGSLDYDEQTFIASLTFAAPLGPGYYQISIGPGIRDLAGNQLTSTFISTFRTFDFTDADGDGFPDELEAGLGLNPTIPDSDGDGILDGDEDSDHDGVTNSQEALVLGTHPGDNDSDDDGILDGDEDPDLDALTNRSEFIFTTNPLDDDSDGDDWNDEVEVTVGSNPIDPTSTPNLLVPVRASVNLALGGNDSEVPVSSHLARPTVNVALPGKGGNLPPASLLGKPPVTVEIDNQPKIGLLRR